MIYSVNEQGVSALRNMASDLTRALEDLEVLIGALQDSADGMADLGPHRASLDAALSDIRENLKQAAGPAETVAEKLQDVAEAYEEIIRDDPFRRVGSSSYGSVSEAAAEALRTPVSQRNPRQVELADLAVHGEYADQKSFETDPETGRVQVDEGGEPIEAPFGTKGSQRPDGYRIDENGHVDLREQKDYTNVNNLIRNITKQTEKRRVGFGEDVHITFVLAVNQFTVGDAERINALAEELGVDIEWMVK